MRVVGLPRAFYHIARHRPVVLSPQAQERLRWLSCWQALRKQGFHSPTVSSVSERVHPLDTDKKVL